MAKTAKGSSKLKAMMMGDMPMTGNMPKGMPPKNMPKKGMAKKSAPKKGGKK